MKILKVTQNDYIDIIEKYNEVFYKTIIPGIVLLDEKKLIWVTAIETIIKNYCGLLEIDVLDKDEVYILENDFSESKRELLMLDIKEISWFFWINQEEVNLLEEHILILKWSLLEKSNDITKSKKIKNLIHN